MVTSISDPKVRDAAVIDLTPPQPTGNPRYDALNDKIVAHRYWTLDPKHKLAVRGDFSDCSFHQSTIRNVDLSNAKARRMYLVGVDVSGTRFNRTDARNSTFRGSYVHWCDWSSIDMRGTDCTGASFNGTDFSNGNLSKCKFDYASFWKCDMTNVNIKGSTFKGITAYGKEMHDYFRSKGIKFNVGTGGVRDSKGFIDKLLGKRSD